eukprot:SAG22_NODE_1560_length_4122_cov_235.578921_2_plen_62_part_00
MGMVHPALQMDVDKVLEKIEVTVDDEEGVELEKMLLGLPHRFGESRDKRKKNLGKKTTNPD